VGSALMPTYAKDWLLSFHLYMLNDDGWLLSPGDMWFAKLSIEILPDSLLQFSRMSILADRLASRPSGSTHSLDTPAARGPFANDGHEIVPLPASRLVIAST
jgi:hypothetical protein